MKVLGGITARESSEDGKACCRARLVGQHKTLKLEVAGGSQ